MNDKLAQIAIGDTVEVLVYPDILQNLLAHILWQVSKLDLDSLDSHALLGYAIGLTTALGTTNTIEGLNLLTSFSSLLTEYDRLSPEAGKFVKGLHEIAKEHGDEWKVITSQSK